MLGSAREAHKTVIASEVDFAKLKEQRSEGVKMASVIATVLSVMALIIPFTVATLELSVSGIEDVFMPRSTSPCFKVSQVIIYSEYIFQERIKGWANVQERTVLLERV